MRKAHIPPAPRAPRFLNVPPEQGGYVPSQYKAGAPVVRAQYHDPRLEGCSSVTGQCAATRMDLPGAGGPADYPPCKPGRCLLRRWQSQPEYAQAVFDLYEARERALHRDEDGGTSSQPVPF